MFSKMIRSIPPVFILCFAIPAMALSPSGMEQMNEAKGPYFGPCEDIEWVNWAVVLTHPGMIARHDYMSPRQWTNEELHDFINDFDPDEIQCWVGQPFAKSDIARSRGIAVSGGLEYEWESGIHGFNYFEDQIFKGNGIGVTENGSLAVQRRYQTRGMTHMAPKWHEVVKAGSVRWAYLGDSVDQDNIIHGIRHPYGQFDDYANKFFLEYLQKHFSNDQLEKWDVDPKTFHIRKHLSGLRQNKLNNRQICVDPVIHEFIRFHYIELTRKMIDVMNQAKAVRVKNGLAIPAWYGNLSGMTSHRSFGITLSQYTDTIMLERSEYAQPCHKGKDRMNAWSTLMHKNSAAAGNFEKPVWTFTYDSKFTNIYRRLSIVMANAEAIANGGVHVQCKRREIPEGTFRDVNRHHAQLAAQNRVFFTDRSRFAKTAIIRSVPSEHWGFFSTLSFDRPHLEQFGIVGRVLEDNHIMYEVAILGHPDFYDDSKHIARLGRYETLILPYVECIADYQIEALEKWTRNGGRLILWSNCGQLDEEMDPRKQNAFENIKRDPGRGTVVEISTQTAEDYWNQVNGAEQKILAKIDNTEPYIKTDVGKKIWFNCYRHGAGPMISVAMINYDLEPVKDIINTRKNFTFSVKVDNPSDYKKAYYIYDDYKTYGAKVPEMVELDFAIQGDYLTVTIPNIDIIGVVAFASEGEFDARNNAAKLRKAYHRFKIAKRARWQQLTQQDEEVLRQAKDILSRIQGNVKVYNFAQISRDCDRMGQKLNSGIKQTASNVKRRAVDQATQNIWADSEYKFDFGVENNSPYGWETVTDQTVYLKERGYGWTEAQYLASVKCISGDKLHGDYVRSQNPREQLPGLSFHYPFILPPDWRAKFRVDLPNGRYHVTVICGDEEAHYCQNRVAITYVNAQGEPALYGNRIPMGFYDNRTFPVTVENGFIELMFWGRNVGPLYANDCDWLVNGLIIQKTGEQLTDASQKSLAETNLHDRAVVREWSVIGPFKDEHCMGLDVYYPAEELDLSGEYKNADKTLKWQQIDELEGFAPSVYFSKLFFGTGEEVFGGLYEAYTPGIEPSVGFAATFVYMPEDMEVQMESSSTQMAECFVNDIPVFRDEYIAGVLPKEDSVKIKLKTGWNSIMLKTTCHWGDEWASWLSLYSSEGKPLSEMKRVLISSRPRK